MSFSFFLCPTQTWRGVLNFLFFPSGVFRHPCEGKVNVVSDLSLRISGTSYVFHLIMKWSNTDMFMDNNRRTTRPSPR